MFKGLFKILGLMLMVLFLNGCKQVNIVHELTEKDANEILVILAKYNIKAVKEQHEENQKVTWIVKLDAKDEGLARAILVANNLPRVRLGGLKGICEESGMILTAKTEKCRELLAYKGEIINLLESVACVVSADVVLNIPDKPDFPDENTPLLHPTATASVKYLKDCGGEEMAISESRVQDIVSNAVSGLDPRDVTVVISLLDAGIPLSQLEKNSQDKSNAKAEAIAEIKCDSENVSTSGEAPLVTLAGLKLSPDSLSLFKGLALGFLVLILILSVALVFVVLKMAKLRKNQDNSKALAKS